MANNVNPRGTHVAPGVYAKEVDLTTTSSQTLGATTLGLVGETLYGPAFQPVWIEDYGQFKTYFGGQNPATFKGTRYPKYELPYIAKSYLDESNQLYVTRVLGLSGFEHQGEYIVYNEIGTEGASKPSICALLRPTFQTVNTTKTNENGTSRVEVETLTTVTGVTFVTASQGADYYDPVTKSYTMRLSKSNGAHEDLLVSLNPDEPNFITKVIGSSPESAVYGIYAENTYEANCGASVTKANIASPVTSCFRNYKSAYKAAQTPYFVSDVRGGKVAKLFRLVTIADGDSANTRFKVSIRNIDKNKSTFDVVIRDFNDTDDNLAILESFSGCTMNPEDVNFIGAKIGTVDGLFLPKSSYVLVDLFEDSTTSLDVPMGFQGYPLHDFSLAVSDAEDLEIPFSTIYDSTKKARKQYFGVPSNIDTDFLSYKGEEHVRISKGFHLNQGADDYVTMGGSNDGSEISLYDIDKMKFTCCFYGGFDGWDISRTSRTNTNEFKANNYNKNTTDNLLVVNAAANTNKSDYYAYLKAYETMSDPESVDINIFATPGIDINSNSALVDEVIEIIENERQDCLYIVTCPDHAPGAGNTIEDMYSESEATSFVEGFDTNYAATYFPWIQVRDTENNKYIFLPPTKDVVTDMAYTDSHAYPWYAPAGMQRGGVSCIKARKSLKKSHEDILYKGRINPVKTFASDGVYLMGQKTLQERDTALNRINVRRLMLRMKKLVMRASNQLVFNQNDDSTVRQFYNLVNPILHDIKDGRGITDYKIITDDSIEAREQLRLPATIKVKPIRSLEYIELSFELTPEGVNFND